MGEESGSIDMPFGETYEGAWSGSTSLAPSESSWSFLPAGSQILDSILGTAANAFTGIANAAQPRIAYELNKPVIREGSQGSQNWIILLVALGVGVYLLTR